VLAQHETATRVPAVHRIDAHPVALEFARESGRLRLRRIGPRYAAAEPYRWRELTRRRGANASLAEIADLVDAQSWPDD
jgi:hypothetical protein